ncbi:MAG: alkyldihydroxyacetonephosphate synthase [Frankiaceae bacterium]|nr:alkyldihydroxyacetonephosphate synthase [Frankiaceae bacterium]
MRALLRDELGRTSPSTAVPVERARLSPSALPAAARDRLVQALGEDAVRVDDEVRATHAGGQSYAEIIRRRRGDAGEAPDAVLLPADAGQVAAVLRICTEERVAVVPWGGGTSVVGGLAAERGDHSSLVALDLSRLDQLLTVDEVSLLATFQPGIRTPAAEAALAAYGLTLGHVPQSFERASLGGYVVTRSAGQASTGRGRIDDLVVGLRMQTPVGELALPALPGSAAGPDLRRLVLGSEGTLGVVTEVTLRVRRLPAVRRYEGWMVPSWEDGQAVLRRLAQDGPHPDIARLSDRDETRVSLAMSSSGRLLRRALATYLRVRGVGNGCLVITGYEGGKDDVAHRRRAVRKMLRRAGGVPLGAAAGRAWEHGRFAGPSLRDALLDAGVLAETLETAATWTDLPRLYAGVRAALHASLGRALVGCHVSHLYPTGASLYFTALAAADAGGELEQWAAAKKSANDAIVAAGGTITHHHAVGTAHRDHVANELGAVGIDALRAVKQRLDPAGILNPGKLLPPPD